MADITIQQAYALAMGVYVNPYRGGRLDGGTLLGLDAGGINICFAHKPNYLAVFGTNPAKNRLQRLLDGTNINLTPIPGPTDPDGLDLSDQSYTLVSRTAVLANTTAGGFETPIFEPREFIGATRQNYNYRTGADFVPSSAISAVEQLYHLSGLGILKKIKK